MPPPLADAFLALSDDPLEIDQRTLPRVVVAAVAAVVLAAGAPLGYWALKPDAHPVPALSSKVSLAAPDEE